MATAAEKPEKEYSRRGINKQVAVGSAAVILPSFATVTTAQTDSGSVEVNSVSTIPSGCSISITVYEDTSGDGNADRSQERELPDGEGTRVFDILQGYEGQAYEYWVEITLSQETEGESTPELHSLEIVLPEDEADSPDGTDPVDRGRFTELLDNPLVFIAGSIFAVMSIGMASKSLAVAAWGGYMTFTVFAITSGIEILENILYVTLVLIFIGFAFKFWRLEGMGE